LLFVYGSLKRGQANHGQLHAARFVAPVRTAARFALRMIDGYPALVPGDRSIVGELYQLPTEAWLELDDFEGEGYQRTEVELEGGARAIAYLSSFPSAGAPLAADEWPM
jgi:gamma-glutamylcyclotransferase (GGCT)/AIG2-like uncharacterized protein YtfP